MPCYDSRDDANVVRQDLSEAQAHIDKLTRLLCEAGKVYHREQGPSYELVLWWDAHRKVDAGRKK